MSRPRFREFIALLSVVVAVGTFLTEVPSRAQSTKGTPVIGLLATTATMPGSARVIEAFRQSLAETGWVEGKTVRLESRWSEGRSERFPALAAELVRLKVDVMVTSGSLATKAAMEATPSIPIVFVAVADPIGSGFVASLGRPGGHVTGVTNQFSDLAGKSLQLARDVVPGLRHIAIVWNPADSGSALGFKRAQDLYPSLGVKVTSAPVGSPDEFDRAFEIVTQERPDFLEVHPTPVIQRNRQRIAEFALRKRIPTITGFRAMVEDGSLMMSYGPDFADLFRQAAHYVDKILKGARPVDLPVEQPTRFELIVNRRVAGAIGVSFPPEFLARADHVIE